MTDPWVRRDQLADGVTIYQGDCREIVPLLAGIDAIISDPPYGIGYQHSGGQGANGKHWRVNAKKPIVGDDKEFDPRWMLPYCQNILLWGSDHFAKYLPHGRWLAWNKLDGVQSFDNFSDVEFAWHNQRGAARIFTYLWKGILQAGSAKTDRGGFRDHPTQKPVQLMAWCFEQAKVPPRGRILDPYMGSGTTGVAAIANGFRFTGIEITEEYYEVARERIAKAIASPDLFVPPPPKPTQLTMELPRWPKTTST